MSEASSNPSWLSLKSCVEELRYGPWKFIRLRGSETEVAAIDEDDVDLLGSRASVNALLDRALQWVREGRCHVRVKTGSPDKVGLHLISHDANHRLDLDLWINLRQIDDRKRGLTYEGCQPALEDSGESIQRLPLALEAAVFIHHLVSKRKKISSPKQLARLTDYAARCRAEGNEGLAAALESTAGTAAVSDATAALTLRLLENQVTVEHPGSPGRILRRIRTALADAWFSPPGKFPMLTVMGCDGCGKTTLSKLLREKRKDIRGVYTGKHLYRKWIIYKLLVIFVRPLLFQGREKFDDTFAPLAYLLASLRLRLKLLFSRKGLVLIDRSLVDFLMVARKTDRPKFCASVWLASIFGVRLPHVHFMVPFERLKERKLEMTEQGHTIYDAEMFRLFSRRAPTDYLAFDNRGSLEESAAALGRIVDWLKTSA